MTDYLHKITNLINLHPYIRILLLGSSFMLVLQNAGICQSVQTISISGLIVDDNKSKPLPDANIYLEQLKSGTTSGKDGSFIIKNVPEGNYNLTVSFLGYKKHDQKITVKPGENLNLTIYLKEQAYTKGYRCVQSL